MDKANIFLGDLSWLFEGIKITNENFDIDFCGIKPNRNINTFQFFECIIFNQEKVHSLYFNCNNQLNEYFNNDRCELILKLLKIFVYKYSESFQILNEKAKGIKIEKNQKIDIYISDLQRKIISNKIKANIYIQYLNGEERWIDNYEIKRLLFNFTFLKDYENCFVVSSPLAIYKLSWKICWTLVKQFLANI